MHSNLFTLPTARVASPKWSLDTARGRLTELSGVANAAQISVAAGLIHQAQLEGEPVCWVASPQRLFFPPDLADSGIDLEALLIVRAPELASAAKAATRVLQSEAFGVVIFDWFEGQSISIAALGRLTKLAQSADAAVVFITEKGNDTQSLGSMISLRVAPTIEHIKDNRYRCDYLVLKDKKKGPTWSHTEELYGPAGLR